jgi:predicted RNA-binding protein with PIN domain
VKRTRWPADIRRYRWIVDGHNAIFAHPVLEALQVGDQKAEARRRLEGMLERFGAIHGLDIQIVYDGNRMDRNPDARRDGRVRSVYSLAPHEEADDRIVLIATQSLHEGIPVVVVSSDRATLGARLPSSVIRVEPSEVFRRLESVDEDAKPTEGRPPGDFSDIEAHFLALAAEAPPRTKPRRARGASAVESPRPLVAPPPMAPRPEKKATKSPAPPPPPPPATPTSAAEREAKRARGERAQRRRIDQLRKKIGKKTNGKGGR